MALTGWQSVEIDDKAVDIKDDEKGPLDEEPSLNQGIASAMQLSMKKGEIFFQFTIPNDISPPIGALKPVCRYQISRMSRSKMSITFLSDSQHFI